MAFDISQLFGQGTINRLMTSQLTGPQSTFTNQSAVQNVTSPQPTPAPLMQNVPGSLSAGLGGPQSSDPWSGMRQASTPSQQAFPDDLGDKLARGLHNFASSSTGQWLNNMFAGWAQGNSPDESIAKGGMSVANGNTRNHTVDLLVKNGFDPQSAQAIAGDPAALNGALKTVMDRQNPDHQLQTDKTKAEIAKLNAAAEYYSGKGSERFVNTGGGFMFDRKIGQYIRHPDPAPNSGKPDNATVIADAIVNGSQPPDMSGLYKLSGPVRAELARRGFDLSKASEDWQAAKKHWASLNGPQQLRLRQAVDFTSHSLDLVDQLADQWNGGQFPVLNAANLAAAKQGAYGPDAASIATRLSASVADTVSEMGNVYMGGNATTDHALRLAAENLNTNWSTKTMHDATDQIRKTLTYRQNSLKNIGPATSQDGGGLYPPPIGEHNNGAGPSVPAASKDSDPLGIR